jgi:hypothetical protein
MPSLLQTPATSRYAAESGAGWDQIVRLTVEACLHRSEGRERVALAILQDRLPAAIRAWSQNCGASAAACKESLQAMFARVREQIAISSVQRRLLMAELSARVPAPAPAPVRPAAGPVYLRHRVRFDDIPGMLDALAGAEADCAAAAPTLTAEAAPFALSL